MGKENVMVSDSSTSYVTQTSADNVSSRNMVGAGYNSMTAADLLKGFIELKKDPVIEKMLAALSKKIQRNFLIRSSKISVRVV